MRIAIVNDLALAVEALRRALSAGGVHTVAWVARDGEEAVEKCAREVPDLILMDLVMPRLDGVGAIKRIMKASPCAILVVTASLQGNSGRVYEALAAGALDVVQTPEGAAGVAMLREKVNWLARRLEASRLASAPAGLAAVASRGGPAGGAGPKTAELLVGIGSSAGGPGALAILLGALPADFPAAFVVVQHIDAAFCGGLVSWLGRQSPLKVRAAGAGAAPRPGEVHVATGDRHLVLDESGRLALTDQPRDHVYLPSIDVFFASMARNWKQRGAGVLLTGMGRDGAAGLLALRRAGFVTIAQDKASSAVYGMPKAAAELGAAADILPLSDIAPRLRAITHSAGVGGRAAS